MNYPKILIRKVVLGSIALSLTLICLVSTTFAWFARNQNAWIQDFDIDLTGVEGLQLSLDGQTNWRQDITSTELKEYIANTVQDFDKIEFGCVSVKHNQDGTIKFDDNKQVQFGYDNVVQDQQTKEFSHETVDAEANKDKGYIKFDLYVRSVASYKEKRTYSLRMTDVTNITSDPVDVKLSNSLTTRELGLDGKYTNNYVQYNTNDSVKVDISNAVRFGMYTVDQDNDGSFSRYNSFDIYEMTNEYDLGSSAVKLDDYTDKDRYNPDLNAMYTYYNNYFVRYPFTDADLPDGNADAFKTKTRDQLLEKELGRFNYVSTKDSYNIIKLELYIWLEGWDADYFVGIPENTKIKVDLEFGIEVVTN